MGTRQQRLKPANLALILSQHSLALSLRLIQSIVIQNRLEMLGHLPAIFHLRRLDAENAQTLQHRWLARTSVVQHLLTDLR